MARAAFVLLLVVLLVGTSRARIFSRSQLIRELRQQGFREGELGDWVCLVEHESSYNTAAVGRGNVDGSVDYGLFQINSRYWCGTDGPGGECNIRCSDLLKDDISKAVVCVRRIFACHGFSAWVAWRNHCQGRDLSGYLR